MLNLIYRLYFIQFSNIIVDSYYQRLIARIINDFAPVYFKVTNYFLNYKIGQMKAGTGRYVVSLTTFPKRIDIVWLTIESIIRQRVKPDLIVLWLSKDEFSGGVSLPKVLQGMTNRGLQIRMVDGNIMPHKKYYYAIQEYNEDNIITIDDDMIYPHTLVSNLIKHHTLYPKAICCSITRKIAFSAGKIGPYRRWEYVRINTRPLHQNLVMGGGGTLFPPGSLSREVLNLHSLRSMAFRTDDLWLKIMALLSKTPVVSLAGEYSRFFVTIRKSQGNSLMHKNIDSFNDENFQLLMDHYKIGPHVFLE